MENQKLITEKESYIISIVHVIAMILVLLAHLVQESSNFLVTQTAQIFNVGVFLFLFISGFIYGHKDIKDKKEFYLKRAKRILIPLYIFVIFLFIVYKFYLKENIEFKYYFIYLFNLQGILGGIKGAQHLWFLTALMFCYLVTPFLNSIKKFIKDTKEFFYTTVLILAIQIFITIFISGKLGLYFSYMSLYSLAYFIGTRKYEKISKKNMTIFSVITLFFLVIRLISKILIDSTIVYDRIIVIYEQSMFAIWIFTFMSFIKTLKKENKFILYLDNISFYIYITHIPFMTGPLRTMGFSNSFLINSFITIIISYASAVILKVISEYLYKILKTKKLYKGGKVSEGKHYSSSV